MDELGGAPLLVGDEQHAELGEALGLGGERSRHPEREDDAALHVDRPGAVQPIAIAAQRRVRARGRCTVSRCPSSSSRAAPRPAQRWRRGRRRCRRSSTAPARFGTPAAGTRRTARSPPRRPRDRLTGSTRRPAPRAPARPGRRSRRRARCSPGQYGRCRAVGAPRAGGAHRRRRSRYRRSGRTAVPSSRTACSAEGSRPSRRRIVGAISVVFTRSAWIPDATVPGA